MRLAAVSQSAEIGQSPAKCLPERSSLAGLSWLNFLVAMMQTGFGTFIAVNLTAAHWSRTDVGLALSVASVAGIVAQVPGGMLVDITLRKRRAAGAAILIIALAAVVLALWQEHAVVYTAMALQGSASAVLTPAIAAISLALVAKTELAQRLGLNTRYAALGTALAAGAMGVVGTFTSSHLALMLAGIFGFGAIFALHRIRGEDLARAAQITDHAAVITLAAGGQWSTRGTIARNRDLLYFAGCIALFQLGNAGVLPLAVGSVLQREGHRGDLVVAVAVIVSQVLAAILSSPMGKMAEQWGRKPVLLLGLGALVVKAGLFAFDGSSLLVVIYQSFDAISAASFGVMLPLMVADITHKGGHFNLAMGLVGLASSLGAAMSTVMAGAVADRFGVTLAYGLLAAIGAASVLLARWKVCETGRC